VTRQRFRRVLWAVCLLAAVWAFAVALTGGFIIHLGDWRLSSRTPKNPLLLAVLCGLAARWLSPKDGDDEGLALWRWCHAHFPVLLVAAAAFELLVILRPAATGFLGYPLAVPDVFTPPPPLKPFALPLVLLAGAAVLSAGAAQGTKLFARPRRTLVAVFLLGLALHFAMLSSLQQGLPFFAERAISSGHGIFMYEAVAVDDLGATLEQYEPFVRRNVYLSVKGPGILVFFRGLNIVANSAVVRPLLAPLAPSAIDVPPWLIEWGFAPGTPHAGQTLEEMRYLLALMFVLYPVLTLLPVFFVFWVARVFVDDTFGLIAAMTFIVTPEAHLSFSHLDFSLFPLLAIGTVAPFVIGVRRQRLRYVAASAVVFTVYFSITLAAVSVVMMLGAWLGIEAWQRLRRQESSGRVVIDVVRASGVFGLVSGLMLAAMYVGIHFHPVERYSYARLVQRDWVTSDYNLQWVMANALGYILSFGLVQTGLLLAQGGRSAWRVSRGTADGIGSLAVAWLCLVVFLLAFGRQHGETNRLWTFLTPVGCLIVARYIYDVIPQRRWWLPVSVFFVSLVLMRYRLNYF
jgi:hypothetical protein